MNAHLESTLFYTMSTIAQTLAGAMGLLGAIVLFALQATGRSVEDAASRLAELPHETASSLYVRHLLGRRSFQELADLYEGLLSESTETNTELLFYHSVLAWQLQHEHAIRQAFWKALLASGGAVSASILSLALAPQLASRPPWGAVALVVTVAGAIGCLILYGIVLRVLLHASPKELPASPRRRR